MPYDGNPEIKEVNGAKYLYMRKRVAGKLTSTYVNVYSDELYQLLLRNAKERKDLNKTIRKINKDLTALGYEDKEPIDIAIELCMYCMKTQVFKDGNKRASVIFANHYLIAQGRGF